MTSTFAEFSVESEKQFPAFDDTHAFWSEFMQFKLIIKKSDGSPLASSGVDWRIQTEDTGDDFKDSGTNDTTPEGLLEFTSDAVTFGNYVILKSGEFAGLYKVQIARNMTVAKEVIVKKVETQSARDQATQFKEFGSQYDVTENNKTNWDWLVWETEGNSDPKYQRGARERQLGLYSLNYHLLRKAGGTEWAKDHDDGTVGGGWVKVAFLDQYDYSEHTELISTFLPCFSIKGKKPVEPAEKILQYKQTMISRSVPGDKTVNTLDVQPPLIIMPFNYDDNSGESKAIGMDLEASPLVQAEAKRLAVELPRWATASRSTITSFASGKPDFTPHAEKKWTLRPTVEKDPDIPQVRGRPGEKTFSQYQTDNSDKRYYSVKTGVDFVATMEQGKTNHKDKLEENSIHAMSRSNLIAGLMNQYGEGKFEARYQIEVLSILLGEGGSWDGIQVREIGNAGKDEVWFPALSIPSQGKAFAEAWKKGCDWIEFWEENFATPLGRAKAEMMAFFGLQHMTSNAQNFLTAFDRNSPGSKAKHLILRDIGDTLLHGSFFDVLKNVNADLFKTTWDKEVADAAHGITLIQDPGKLTIGGGYSNPQITRIAASIVFFYPPFLKGDIDTAKDPSKLKIIARWVLAHNNGFLDYMTQKVGYKEDWSAGADTIDPPLKESIWKNADLSISGKSAEYADLADAVVKLSATTRQRLIREIKSEIESFTPSASNNAEKLQRLTAGHELLICAEVHNYIQSPAGKQAIIDLHKQGGTAAVSTAASASGPACYICKTAKPPAPKGWYECEKCGSFFCNKENLKYPAGTTQAMKAITEERRCGKESCNGFAEPIAA